MNTQVGRTRAAATTVKITTTVAAVVALLVALLPAQPAYPSPPPATGAGSLDTTFGTAGIATIALSNYHLTALTKTIVQPDGKILVGGYGTDPTGSRRIVIARLNANGSLDTDTFGPIVGDDVGPVTRTGFVNTGLGKDTGEDGGSFALQPDGKIVVVGSVAFETEGGVEVDLAVKRFTADGLTDIGFGASDKPGETDTFLGSDDSRNDYGTGVAILPSGQILVTAWAGAATPSVPAANADFALVRFSSTGALDNDPATGFGPDHSGIVKTDFNGGDDTSRDLAVMGDGRIVVAGFARVAGQDDIGVVRYTADGLLDASFGPGAGGVNVGRVTIDSSANGTNDGGLTVAVVPSNGDVLVSGAAFVNSTGVIDRLNASGQPVAGWGNGGVFANNYEGTNAAYSAGLVLDSANRPLVVGTDLTNGQMGLDRLLTAGATPYDTGFGNGGQETFACSGGQVGSGSAAGTQPDGKVLAVGSCVDGSLMIARVTAAVALANLTLTVDTPTSPAGHEQTPLSAIDPAVLLSTDGHGDLPSVPLNNSPLNNSPLNNSPLNNSPLNNSPLNNSGIAPSIYLSQIPLASPNQKGQPDSWEQRLVGTKYADVPVNAVTFKNVLDLPNAATVLQGLTLANIDLQDTGLRNASLAAILLDPIPLIRLPIPAGSADWCAFLASGNQPFNCGNGANPNSTTLLTLELRGDNLGTYEHQPIPIGPATLVGPGNPPAFTATLATVLLANTNLAASPLGRLAANSLPSSIVQCPCGNGSSDVTLASAQQAGKLTPGATLGRLMARLPAALATPQGGTLGSVLLGDLVAGLISANQFPIESARLGDTLDRGPLRTANLPTYAVGFDLDCSQAQQLQVVVSLPGGFRYSPGSSTVTVGSGSPSATGDPSQSSDGSLVYQLGGSPFPTFCAPAPIAQHVVVRLKAEPSLVLGPTTSAASVATANASLAVDHQAPLVGSPGTELEFAL